MKLFLSVVLGFLLLVWPHAALAADSPATRATLRALSSVKVAVEPIGADVERDGLTASQLADDVEVRVRQEGIRVSDVADGYLDVTITALKQPDGGYLFGIDVEFKQPVSLLRISDTGRGGSTWSTGTVGLAGLANFPGRVRQLLRERVDAFITAYQSVNPKS
jgi:hypothetical protein